MKAFCATLLLVASAVAVPHHEKSPGVGQNVVPSASPAPVPYPGQVPAYPAPYQFSADFGSPFARSGFAAKAAPAPAYGAYQPYQQYSPYQAPYYPSSGYSGYPTPYSAQSAYPGAYYNGYSGSGAYPYSGYPYNSYSSSAYPSGYPAFRSQFADPAVGQYSQYSSPSVATPYSAVPYSAAPYSGAPVSHQQPSLYNQAQFQPQQYPYSPNSAAAPSVANDSSSKVTAENK